MNQKLKRALTNNIGLKILAIVFSFFLWLVVVNIDDPKQTRTFTAVVTVTNDDVISDMGKIYEIKDGINTVSFRVTAKRSIIEKLSSSDFTATADMEYLESGERVPVTITANSYASQLNISSKQNYLYVVLTDELTERFVISATTTGTPASDVAIESVECSPTVITVSGREKQVESIETVVACCDVTDISADITESVIPKFYDKDGNEVDSSGLKLSVSTVDVSVDFDNMKSVDINVKTSGTLPDYLTLGSITTDPSSVILKGEPAVLNEITSITIPDTVINLSDVTGSFSTTVDISAYLPDGVSIAEGSSKVTVYVKMAGDEVNTVQVPTKNISFANLSDGLTASIDVDTIDANVFGSSDALSKISGSSLAGIIDCSGLTAGESQTALVQFSAVDDITIQNTTVTITIKKSSDSESTEE